MGYGETEVPRSDDGSLDVDFSSIFTAGFDYFGVYHDASMIFVNTNGTLSFGAAAPDHPTAAAMAMRGDLIAPFWADVDTRLDGEGPESGGIWVDLDTASATASVTWLDVGVYRRDATTTNTFQLQLINRGGADFDIVYRYESIQWTQGTAPSDSGAVAGVAAQSLGDPHWIIPAGDAAAALALPTTLGNTGQAGLWVYEMRGGAVAGVVGGVTWMGSPASETYTATAWADTLDGGDGTDTLFGGGGDDFIFGGATSDKIFGDGGHDTLYGGDGADTLVGGDGNDRIYGGATDADLRDIVYGGAGDDSLDGGYGNDELRGDGGNDTITGGYGVDTIIGGTGDDVLTGQAWSDLIYGSDGDDFINGGFGYDRVNGGAGADRFFHIGLADHGSDWIQDYSAAEHDVLVFGAQATADQFQVNFTETPNAGVAGVQEAFVIYRPSGQILWALVDGAAQDSIFLRISGVDHDLLI